MPLNLLQDLLSLSRMTLRPMPFGPTLSPPIRNYRELSQRIGADMSQQTPGGSRYPNTPQPRREKPHRVRNIFPGILPGASARSARPLRRWRLTVSSMTVTVALAGTCLAAVFAAPAEASPPVITPPAPGVTPGTVVTAMGVDMFYTATDGTVWITQGVSPGGPPVPYGGRLVSAPAPIWTGSAEIVFGEGTDHQLWYNQLGTGFGTPWHSLGGQLTSAPGAVSLGGGAYAVFVRGTDGAVWQRVHSGTVWHPWQRVGGHVLAGTGPTAAYLTGTGHIYVGVVGTDRQMYLTVANRSTGFFSIGGQTTASPALTAISPSTLVAFSRGTNGAGYYNRYTEAEGLTGWRAMGGRLTSGLAAARSTVAGKATTYTFGLGTNNQVYEKIGTWATYPPAFSGWIQQTG